MFGIDDALGLGLPLAGGLIGNLASQSDRNAAQAAQLAALQQFQSLNAPQLAVNFAKYNQVGQYSPQMEQAISQSPSLMNNVQVDPGYRDAQLKALQGLQQISNQGGLTIQDQANLNKMLSQQAQQEAGARGAIQQNFAQRGMGGSGFELAQQLLNQQGAANRANETGTNIAGQAQMRALQALQNAGSMAGNMSAQDFAQQAQRAQAQDLINRFNTQNQQSVANTNTQAQNQGQLYNLQSAQNLANQNTQLTNQQQLQNNNYQQQQYQDQLQKAAGESGQYNSMANTDYNNANQVSNMYSGIGQGAGNFFSSLGAQDRADQRWNGYLDALQGQGKKSSSGDLSDNSNSYFNSIG